MIEIVAEGGQTRDREVWVAKAGGVACSANGCREEDNLVWVQVEGFGERVVCTDHLVQLLEREVRKDQADMRYVLPRPGARVRDREGGGDCDAVVVETHPEVAACDFLVDELGETVAELNGSYDSAAPVVEVVFLSDVDDGLELREVKLAVACGEVSAYAFPTPRLEVLDEGVRVSSSEAVKGGDR